MDPLLRHAILCIAFGLAIGGWFVFMAFFTRRHERVTESENSFWVRIGLMSATTAAKVARIEKSIAFKALYAMLALAFLILGARYLMLRARLRSHLPRAPGTSLTILGHEMTKSSNQAMELTAARTAFTFSDDQSIFHFELSSPSAAVAHLDLVRPKLAGWRTPNNLRNSNQ